VSVSVIRELYPSLLRKGDRGKFHDITNVPGQYGEQVRSDECRNLEDRSVWSILFWSSLRNLKTPFRRDPRHYDLSQTRSLIPFDCHTNCFVRWLRMVWRVRICWTSTRGAKSSWEAMVSTVILLFTLCCAIQDMLHRTLVFKERLQHTITETAAAAHLQYDEFRWNGMGWELGGHRP
jgi:hypothetical protein